MTEKTKCLTGRTAIVTGASAGIGMAIAEDFLLSGAKVLVVSRNAEKLAQAASALREKTSGAVDLFAGDVADPALAQHLVDAALGKFDGLDIVVCNAGGPPMGSLLQQSLSEWDHAIKRNLMSVVSMANASIPIMKKRGYGRLISISSTIALEPTPEMVLSATVRAGVSAFTKAISTDFASDGVTANVICPGGVLTARLKTLVEARAHRESRDFEAVLSESQASIPMKKFALPSEIAALATFLASPAASYITGQSIRIDGGLTKSF